MRCAVIWFGFLIVLGTVAQADEHKLAKDGKSAFVIVTPAQPMPEEITAANWLATTLKQAAGADFAIKAEDAADLPKAMLSVGNTAAARKHGIDAGTLQSEEWRIKSVGESLILAGGWPRGTVYAVREFLEEQVGVLRLDPFTEVIPSQPTLTIAAQDRSGRPAFPMWMMFTDFTEEDNKGRRPGDILLIC